VHDEFVEKLSKAMKALKCGNGMDKGIDQGPLINHKAVEKVLQLVEEAVAGGAKLVCGGKTLEGTQIVEPTLLTGVKPTMSIAQSEIFGPVVAIQRFESEEQVLKEANNSRVGLAGYFFSKDLSQISRVSRELQVGMMGVNEGAISNADAAFGGVKESGMGREGGMQGIQEFTQWKYICINTA